MAPRVRLTGVSATAPGGWGLGLEWEYRDSDAIIARRLVTFLEDRRLLWVDLSYEIPDECFRSAEKTREEITREMQTPGIGTGLHDVLGQMRALLQDFMTTGPRWRGSPRFPYGADEFSMTLGGLRAAIGDRLAWIVAAYQLDVDERLATIIPRSGAWFFEQFDANDEARG